MNNLIAKLRKPEDDRGSIVLWTVIIAFGLLLCLGLVVDGGGKLHAKQQAQLVAEEAARAAGQASPPWPLVVQLWSSTPQLP